MKLPNSPLSWLGTKAKEGSWMKSEDKYPDIAIFGHGYEFVQSIFQLVERLFLYGYRPHEFDFVKSDKPYRFPADYIKKNLVDPLKEKMDRLYESYTEAIRNASI